MREFQPGQQSEGSCDQKGGLFVTISKVAPDAGDGSAGVVAEMETRTLLGEAEEPGGIPVDDVVTGEVTGAGRSERS